MNNITQKICVIIILGISIFSFMGCNNSDKALNTDISLENETSKIRLDKKNPIIIDYNNDSYSKATQMIAKNRLEAEETYLNKTIKITGEVRTITTQNDKILVVITPPDRLGAVHLEFDSSYKDKLLDLNLYDKQNKTDGDIITIYGYCSKFDDVCLFLSNCEFE